jgi:hypothetical protein
VRYESVAAVLISLLPSLFPEAEHRRLSLSQARYIQRPARLAG